MALTTSNQRLLLTAAGSSLGRQLESAGFRVAAWPKLEVQAPESFALLDDAIENLYGYDWIIFANADSVRFFLGRLTQLGRDVSDLDAVRVCAVGELTTTALDQAQVHVDIVATQANPSAIVERLSTYAGNVDSLNRLNVLLPQAAVGRDYLKPHIEDAGARADVVSAYQTVASQEFVRLAGLQGMLLSGSLDVVVFASPDEVREFARVFDCNDLSALLRRALVLTTDEETSKTAFASGVSQPFQVTACSAEAISDLITDRLGV